MCNRVYPVMTPQSFAIDIDRDPVWGGIKAGNGDPIFQDYVTIASDGNHITITPHYESWEKDSYRIGPDGTVTKTALFGLPRPASQNMLRGLVSILAEARGIARTREREPSLDETLTHLSRQFDPRRPYEELDCPPTPLKTELTLEQMGSKIYELTPQVWP